RRRDAVAVRAPTPSARRASRRAGTPVVAGAAAPPRSPAVTGRAPGHGLRGSRPGASASQDHQEAQSDRHHERPAPAAAARRSADRPRATTLGARRGAAPAAPRGAPRGGAGRTSGSRANGLRGSWRLRRGRPTPSPSEGLLRYTHHAREAFSGPVRLGG